MASLEAVQASLQELVENCRLLVHNEALVAQAAQSGLKVSADEVVSSCHGILSGIRTDAVSPRQLQIDTFFLSGSDPAVDFAITAACLIALAILWECVFLRSSLSPCRQAKYARGYPMTQFQDLGGILATTFGADDDKGKPNQKLMESDADADERSASLMGISEASRQRFWDELCRIEPYQDVLDRQQHDPPPLSEIGFAHLNFAGKASEGRAEITLYRKGDLSRQVSVLVRPCISAMRESDSVAQNGKDYTLEETRVDFQKSASSTSFVITLHQPRKHAPTEYFEVELVDAGENVTLGGPSVGLDTERPKARVYIFNDFAFPCNIPEHRRTSRFWVTWYYLKERRTSRGVRWWKTLFGLLYSPIHSVCVTPTVLKEALDTVCDPAVPGDKLLGIILLGVVQFASFAVSRWGNKVATENRGRTGGTRQVHRRQLFAKLLMLDAEELSRVEGYWWFYVAINNVDIMAKDSYYQGFVFLQSCWGLLLSLFMLCYGQFDKFQADAADIGAEAVQLIAPALAVVATVALCCVAMVRLPRFGDLYLRRMLGEAAWVDSLSWLCHAGVPLESLDTRLRAKMDARFNAESTYFADYHVKQRDYKNDTLWFTKWITELVYILILMLGAAALLKNREAGLSTFQAGDFQFQLRVFSKCGSYTAKITSCFLTMFSASVGLQQFVDLINLPEKSSLQAGDNQPHLVRVEGADKIVLETAQCSTVVSAPDDLKTARLQCSTRSLGYSVTIPLGTVVRVRSLKERILSNFLHQAGGMKLMHTGCLKVPQGITIGYVPSIALRPPHTKVSQELQDACTRSISGTRLSLLLDIDPDKRMAELHAGEAQLIAIVVALFRDPDVLVLNRPSAFLTESQQKQAVAMVALWQAGGTANMLFHLGLTETRTPHTIRRTVIMSQEDGAWQSVAVSLCDLDLDTGLSHERTLPTQRTGTGGLPDSCSL